MFMPSEKVCYYDSYPQSVYKGILSSWQGVTKAIKGKELLTEKGAQGILCAETELIGVLSRIERIQAFIDGIYELQIRFDLIASGGE